MDFKTAYDLDGVLAVQPPLGSKPWRRMSGPEREAHKTWLVNWYRSAPKLYEPPEARFLVITARKNTPEVTEATLGWLKANLPGKEFQLHMLTKSRSIKNVLEFKSGVLKTYRVEDYTEDNRTVVVGLRKILTSCRIWHFRGGIPVLDYSAPLIKKE